MLLEGVGRAYNMITGHTGGRRGEERIALPSHDKHFQDESA